MCTRRENEHIVVFLIRQMYERPLAVISLAALAAVAYLYHDIRAMIDSQTAAMTEVSRELITIRLKIEQMHPNQ